MKNTDSSNKVNKMINSKGILSYKKENKKSIMEYLDCIQIFFLTSDISIVSRKDCRNKEKDHILLF